MSRAETTSALQRSFPCDQCGGKLDFAPGQQALSCPYCGAENALPEPAGAVEEEDFRAALAALEAGEDHQDCLDVKCGSCGAEVHGLGSRTSLSCPYCDANIVATARSRRLIKPRALLPFRVPRREAEEKFRAWLGGLWFAPGDVKKHSLRDARLEGVYMPAWTYDCVAHTSYTGMKGVYYYVTVPYTRTVNGRRVTGTRRERRVRWTPAAGSVRDDFDDVLVLAGAGAPRELAERLAPWDLKALVPYDDGYLSGFAAESYQVDLPAGFELACAVMRRTIEGSVRRAIGGDVQRIYTMRSRHERVTFKHILLPLWISSYRYGGKVYRFLVNGRSGRVQGDRPWSVAKISLAALAAAALVAVAVLLILRAQGG